MEFGRLTGSMADMLQSRLKDVGSIVLVITIHLNFRLFLSYEALSPTYRK